MNKRPVIRYQSKRWCGLGVSLRRFSNVTEGCQIYGRKHRFNWLLIKGTGSPTRAWCYNSYHMNTYIILLEHRWTNTLRLLNKNRDGIVENKCMQTNKYALRLVIAIGTSNSWPHFTVDSGKFLQQPVRLNTKQLSGHLLMFFRGIWFRDLIGWNM